MWGVIARRFERYPAQLKVARLLVTYGLRIRDGRVHCGDIEVTDSAIARAADVDRRVVSSTVETIGEDPELDRLFSRLKPTAHLMEVAPVMGWSSLEILVEDAREPGILAAVSRIISNEGISIRQAVADDPDLVEDARLFVVTESPVPMTVIPKMKELDGVNGIIIH